MMILKYVIRMLLFGNIMDSWCQAEAWFQDRIGTISRCGSLTSRVYQRYVWNISDYIIMALYYNTNTLYCNMVWYSIILWCDGDLNENLLWKPTTLSFPIGQWVVINCSRPTCCTFWSFRALKWIGVWSDVSCSFTYMS